MFKQTKWLYKLKKEGKLKLPLKNFKKYINRESYFSSGTQVACFRKNKRVLIKVCPKCIKFYQNFTDFTETINKMSQYFMPVNQILFENEDVIIYEQYYCNKIKAVTPYITMSVVLMSIAMFKSGLIITDIGIHNIGTYHRSVYTYDCHGLLPIGSPLIDYTRMSINLSRYLKKYLPVSSSNILADITQTDNEIRIKTLIDKYFNPLYKEYFNTLSAQKQQIIKDKITSLTINE